MIYNNYMKKCSNPICEETKPLEEFHRDKNSRDGFRSRCKNCCNSYYTKNKKTVSAWQNQYNAEHKKQKAQYDALYYEKNKEDIAIYSTTYRQENKEKVTSWISKWKKNNRGKMNSYTANRRAANIMATPVWISDSQLLEIREIYDLAKELQWLSEEPLHVDHIIPLQGKTVSGLHVPWNLQILPASLNVAKGNKLLP